MRHSKNSHPPIWQTALADFAPHLFRRFAFHNRRRGYVQRISNCIYHRHRLHVRLATCYTVGDPPELALWMFLCIRHELRHRGKRTCERRIANVCMVIMHVDIIKSTY